LYMLQREQLHR